MQTTTFSTMIKKVGGEVVWERNRAVWKQIYDELRERIETGVYQPRHPVPSLTQMEEEFGVVRNTARKVIKQLVEDGFVHTEVGVGTFVVQREDSK